MVLDWVTRTAYANSGKGIQWTLERKLEDLEFADDLALLSHRLQDMQDKLTALADIAKKVGLKISKEKTKLMRTNNEQDAPINIEGSEIKCIDEFVYLGSKISQTGETAEDIQARINKARQVFAMLRPVWRATTISTNSKLRIFNSNVKSLLLYGSETKRVLTSTSSKIQTFINRCLRQILRIRWFDKVRNTDLWEKAKQEPIDVQIRERKWRWLGHTLRKDPENTTRQALDLNQQGKRKRGRPRQTWERSLQDDLSSINMSWEEAKTSARDRRRWKGTVEGGGPMLLKEPREF